MNSTPQTPRHSPHPSFDLHNGMSPTERRQSKSSFHDPSTPLRSTFNNPEAEMAIFSSGGAGGTGGAGGLGNLADELADMLSDEEDEYYENDGSPEITFDLQNGGAQQGKDAPRDSGIEVESPGTKPASNTNMTLSPPALNRKGHRRAQSDYDGSEYGSESDLDSPGMPPSLVAKIDAVETLARRGTEKTGSAADDTFQRVTEGLRDLGSQANVEGGATRYVGAAYSLNVTMNSRC